MGGGIKDLWSLDAAFMCMGVLSGIGLLLCIFFLPPTTEEKTRNLKTDIIPWSNLLTDKSILSIFMFRYAYTSCIGIIWCFLPVFADTEFGLSGSLTGMLVMEDAKWVINAAPRPIPMNMGKITATILPGLEMGNRSP